MKGDVWRRITIAGHVCVICVTETGYFHASEKGNYLGHTPTWRDLERKLKHRFLVEDVRLTLKASILDGKKVRDIVVVGMLDESGTLVYTNAPTGIERYLETYRESYLMRRLSPARAKELERVLCDMDRLETRSLRLVDRWRLNDPRTLIHDEMKKAIERGR